MKIIPVLFGMFLAVAAGSSVLAQDSSANPGKPATVIQITREFLKPGKSGMAHDKTEAAFVSLMMQAKLKGHYVALNSMSGKSRALYITLYPSFAAWEADNKIINSNATLAAEYDRVSVADGELLDELDQVLYTYDDELSHHPNADLSQARYVEISVFHVRPGHRKDWYDVTRTWKQANDKAGTGAHWAAYEIAFGSDGGTYISLTSHKSLADIDTEIADGKKIAAAVGGQEGMRKLDDAFWQAVDSTHSELFTINPRQSYPDDQWIKGAPDFWKPQASAATATEPAATASTKPASR
jgi:hypothetical protein